jgi:uncharacterized membrane protein YraQ (UPF0718 family)
MDHIACLSQSFVGYIRELFVPVFLGFLFSGIINEFVPENFVQKYMGDDSIKSIFMATGVGIILPVCCMGSLPIAMTLRTKGARLGPVLAFLIATPATSVPALLITWKMMGPMYTVFMACTVIVMGIVMGLIGRNMSIVSMDTKPRDQSCSDDCCGDNHKNIKSRRLTLRIINALSYAFIELPRKIGFELFLGALIASVIVSFSAVREFVQFQLAGFKGYIILVLIGLIDYVCSTGSVPVAHALVQSGVSAGKSIVYLLMGPITSYAALLVIRKEFGGKVLIFYLGVIAVVSILAGLTYDLLWAHKNFVG